jgi:hypothetical protein
MRAPWSMSGTARVNGPCVMSWAEGLAHSTVWHDTVGTTRHVRVPCHLYCIFVKLKDRLGPMCQ